MQADYMVLADAVAASDGKLFIHGAGWDTVLIPAAPTLLTMALGILLRVPWSETNVKHTLELDILDVDGQSVMSGPDWPLRAEVNVGRPTHIEPGDDQTFPLTINLNGTSMERVGTYVIVLKIDEQEMARTAFRVRLMPDRQAMSQSSREPPAT